MNYLIKFLFLINLLLISTAYGKNIKNIEIIGNQRIDEETIFTYLNFSKNKIIREEDLNILFKDLFATNLFSEIVFKLKDNTQLI